MEDADEETWLANALRQAGFEHYNHGEDDDDDEVLPWEQVIGAKSASGTLTKKFFADPRPAIRA